MPQHPPDLNLPKERVYVREAPFLKRTLAFLADLLLLDFTAFTSFSFITQTTIDRVLAGTLAPSVYAAGIVMSLITLVYFSLFTWLLGQTPGMMLLRLKTTHMTLWKAFVRNCYFLPVFPFPFLLVTEPLYLAWRKRRWLERLTGTRTIEQISY